ncbi:hypothetical protein L873DRAFT_782655 [Choiromyces venosus 120613-1]|uniref:Uncharacterized protein n=1 Tax=Choiromyces venosus 120613-1 TaxID=1336337 RepID=A0A3N4IVN2_9PEZI|nr:hypothetical protein L873DRAFT_782655 [Choiromyces venosus 120613-1]
MLQTLCLLISPILFPEMSFLLPLECNGGRQKRREFTLMKPEAILGFTKLLVAFPTYLTILLTIAIYVVKKVIILVHSKNPTINVRIFLPIGLGLSCQVLITDNYDRYLLKCFSFLKLLYVYC